MEVFPLNNILGKRKYNYGLKEKNMLKRMLPFFIAITLLLGTNTFVYAVEVPAYEITDEYVRIDYVVYEIKNNTIKYNGKTYEIMDYALVSYEEDGTPIVLVLPVEQNKVTDPKEIEELNKITENDLTRALPSSYVNLPYTASVSQGQWMNITPAFKMIQGKFYYYTILKIHEVQLFGDRRFAVKFTYCTSTGDWYDHEFINEWDVPLISNTIKFENLSCMAYGRMAITNLYGDPSPSYKYTISLDNPIP